MTTNLSLNVISPKYCLNSRFNEYVFTDLTPPTIFGAQILWKIPFAIYYSIPLILYFAFNVLSKVSLTSTFRKKSCTFIKSGEMVMTCT